MSLEGLEILYLLFFPNVVVKTQNPSVHDSQFKEPSLANFKYEDRDEMLLCPVRALKGYFSRMEQFRPECSALFILTTKRKKFVSWITISFWSRLVIFHAYQSATDEDYRAVKVKVRELWKIGTSPLLKELCSPAGAEGLDLVIADDFLSLLLLRCHPQAYGHLFHWPFSGRSAGHVAYWS